MAHNIEQMLLELSNISSPSGSEDAVARLLMRHFKSAGLVPVSDGLNNVKATLKGDEPGPTVLVDAHIDEIGFLVTGITEKGFLRFRNIGRWPENALNAQQVRVHAEGGEVSGVIGMIPPHVRDEMPSSQGESLFIDIGAPSRKTAESWGVRPGSFVTPDMQAFVSHDGRRLFGKAWDNRIGVGLMCAVMEELVGLKPPNSVVFLGSSQEEVGKRGLRVALNDLECDVAFVLEGILATDLPTMPEEMRQQCELGGGVNIVVHDAGMIPNQRLLEHVIQIARDNDIRHQLTAAYGSNSAELIHQDGSGCPCLVLGVPARYIHSHVGVVDMEDFQLAKRLLSQVIASLSSEVLAGILDDS